MADTLLTTEEIRAAIADPRFAGTQAGHARGESFDAWIDDHDQAHAVATIEAAVKHLKWFAGRIGPGDLSPGVVAAYQELQLMASRIEGNREASRG